MRIDRLDFIRIDFIHVLYCYTFYKIYASSALVPHIGNAMIHLYIIIHH